MAGKTEAVIAEQKSQIEIRSLDSLKLWDKNPREINDEDMLKLKEQIERLGVYKPLIIDNADGTILGGNMRYRALTDMGYTEVICSIVYPENEVKRLEYALSDNDLKGQTVEQALAELLWAYEDFPLDLYKVHLGVASSLEDVKSKFGPDLESDNEEEPDLGGGMAPVSQESEVYQLGRHRLMCGDSTNPEHVGTLMGEELADLIFTDPPYMVDYHSTAGLTYSSKKYGGSEDDGAIFNDDLNEQDATKFYIDVLKNLYDFSKPSAPIYWWYAMKNHHLNRSSFVETGWHFSQTVIWLKNGMVFSPGQDFHRVYEPCMFGWKKGEKHFQNKRIANMKDVMHLQLAEFESILDLWYESRDSTQDYIHPTQKPTGLCARALKKHTRSHGIVLDLFGGSGSTLMACDELDRDCRLMELDPKFCDAIRRRYAKSLGREEDWEELTPVVVNHTTKQGVSNGDESQKTDSV